MLRQEMSTVHHNVNGCEYVKIRYIKQTH